MADPLHQLRAELGVLKSKGVASVSVASLESYIASLDADSRARGESDGGQAEMAKAHFEAQNAANLEMFKSVIEAGRTALNALILMNGGAAVALLAFMGNALAKEPPGGFKFGVQAINKAMLLFVLGVGFAGVALALRYLSQFVGHGRSAKVGMGMTYLAIVVGLASLALFFAGGVKAYAAFL